VREDEIASGAAGRGSLDLHHRPRAELALDQEVVLERAGVLCRWAEAREVDDLEHAPLGGLGTTCLALAETDHVALGDHVAENAGPAATVDRAPLRSVCLKDVKAAIRNATGGAQVIFAPAGTLAQRTRAT
jgi:hypothetical protein